MKFQLRFSAPGRLPHYELPSAGKEAHRACTTLQERALGARPIAEDHAITVIHPKSIN